MFRFLGGLALTAVSLLLAWAALAKAADHQSTTPEPPAVASSEPVNSGRLMTASKILANAEWFDLIFRGPRQSKEPAPPPRLEGPKRTGGTYRTLCVRLCDGFSFPISYSTSRERFVTDAKQCEQRCPTRSRLFVHRNPGEDVDDMVDLEGRRYRNLPTAFLHQTRYVADCTCRGNPWDEAALARHRAYAEMARQKVPAKQPIRPVLAQTRRAEGQDPWVLDE